jgi:hypothetical protein
MEDVYANNEIAREFGSSSPSAVLRRDVSTSKTARCSSCDRDLSQPNLLPPSISKFCAKPQGASRGHGICGECGGLGSALLDGI